MSSARLPPGKSETSRPSCSRVASGLKPAIKLAARAARPPPAPARARSALAALAPLPRHPEPRARSTSRTARPRSSRVASARREGTGIRPTLASARDQGQKKTRAIAVAIASDSDCDIAATHDLDPHHARLRTGDGRRPRLGRRAHATPSSTRSRRASRTCAARCSRAPQRGEIGFLDLPRDTPGAGARARGAARRSTRRVRDVLVLGIGGSSLGTRALIEALRSPQGLSHPGARRQAAPALPGQQRSVGAVAPARGARPAHHRGARDLEVGRHGRDRGADADRAPVARARRRRRRRAHAHGRDHRPEDAARCARWPSATGCSRCRSRATSAAASRR